MNKFFSYEEIANEEVNIHIYGEIGWNDKDFGGTDNRAYELVSLIKRLDQKYKRINVHINSPGGYIDDGLAIYNTLKSATAEVHTYNNGLVASMASIIMLAGTTHFPKTSIYHLHSASTVTIGNIKEHEQAIESLKVFENALIQAIKAKTNLSEEEIQNNWFDGQEHYLTAEQANEIGFVDVFEEKDVPVPAPVNKLENMSYNEICELYRNTAKNQDKNFLQALKQKFSFNINQEKSKKMANIKLKAKLTALLALVGLDEFVLNANNMIELDINEAFKINDSLETKNNEIEALKQENLAKDDQLQAKDKQIQELKAKLEGKPADSAANPKADDNSKANDEKQTVFIDDDISKKIHEFNRQEGLY